MNDILKLEQVKIKSNVNEKQKTKQTKLQLKKLLDDIDDIILNRIDNINTKLLNI